MRTPDTNLRKRQSHGRFFLLAALACSAFCSTSGAFAAGQPGQPSDSDLPNILPPKTAGPPSKGTRMPVPESLDWPAKQTEKPGDLNHHPRPSDVESHVNPTVNTASVEYDSLPAASSDWLRLPQALSEAMKTGPRAAAIRAQLGITRAGLATATQAPNPSTFMDRGMMAEQAMRIGPILQTDMPWNLYLRLLGAKTLVNQTKVDLLTQIWSLRSNMRKAYVELVVAQETQRTLIQLYELSNRLYVVSKKRYEAGAVPELDVLKGHLLASQSSVDVAVGLRRIAAAKQQLNILIGRPVEAPIFVPPLPDYTTGEPLSKLRAQKSDILPNFDEEVAALKLFVDKAIQSRLELKSLGLQIKLNAVYRQGHVAAIAPSPSIATGKDTAGNEPAGPKITAVFMTLNQELPLTNVQQGGLYQHKAVINQLKFQSAAQENMIYSDVSAAYQNLLSARDKIRVYQERLLKDSNEVARLAQRSYEVGQSDITAALQAQQANIQVRSAYLNAINSYASAFADLEKAVGRPLQ